MASLPQTPPRKQGSQFQSVDVDMDLDFRGASRMTGKNLI
jgi:hypothetical protein